MKNQPLLSIVIPTCDRHYLLHDTVRAYLVHQDPRIEIIVSDNFCDPRTKGSIQDLIDEGLVTYVRSPKRLAMPFHWEFALSYATGRYIMFSGDDDVLIVPELMKGVLELLEQRKPEMVSWKICLYWHQDWCKKWEAGNLQVNRSVTGYLCQADPIVALRQFARLERSYFPHALALIFSKELSDGIKRKHGLVFWPFAPDFTAPCLMLTEVRQDGWLYIDYNLGYGGRSSASNAASYEKNVEEENSKRQKEFETEFEGADLFPHHELKVASLTNILFAPLFLTQHLCPDFFSQHPWTFNFDEFAFCVLREICQIKINQPLIRPGDEQRLRLWLEKHAPGAWQTAQIRLKKTHKKAWQEAQKSFKNLTAHRPLSVISQEKVDEHLKEVNQPQWDGLCSLNADYAYLRCPHLGIHTSLELAKNAHLFFQRFAICSWDQMKLAIDRELLRPICPYLDQNLPYVPAADVKSISAKELQVQHRHKKKKSLSSLLQRMMHPSRNELKTKNDQVAVE